MQAFEPEEFIISDPIGLLLHGFDFYTAPVGMRRGELLGLKWEQIRNGFIYLTETKSGKPRQIPMNDRLAQVFREVRRGNQLKSPYVFCDSRGDGSMK